MLKIVHTKQSRMVAEHATIRGSGVGDGNENVEKVRVEIGDEFGEKASEQCLGGVDEKEIANNMSEEVHGELLERVRAGSWPTGGEETAVRGRC